MSAEYLKLNKKGTKVVITGKTKYSGALATVIQYLPTVGFMMFKFDMFTFNNEGYALTGWGATVGIVLAIAFRSKIKEFALQFDSSMGDTWKRSKAGSVSAIIAVVLFFVYLFSLNFFIIFGIFAGSTFASLFFYRPYDIAVSEKKKLQEMLDTENKTKDFETLKANFNEMKQI